MTEQVTPPACRSALNQAETVMSDIAAAGTAALGSLTGEAGLDEMPDDTNARRYAELRDECLATVR